MTPTESDFLAFVNHIMGETNRLAITAARHDKELAVSLLTLCSTAAQKKRQLLGMPEPDPDVDYDPDCHWDGTERLPGEARREKGEVFSDNLDLSALKLLSDGGKE